MSLYLAADGAISVGNGALEDDALYDSDEEEGSEVLSDDYASIGVKLCKLGNSYY